MRVFYPFPVKDIEGLKQQLLQLSYTTKHFCYLDSNNYPDYPYSTFGSFFAIGAIDSLSVNEKCLDKLEAFYNLHREWLFGFISYDLKNELEPGLSSANSDGIKNPLLHFFIPKYLVKFENDKVEIGICLKEGEAERELKIFKELLADAAKAINSNGNKQPGFPPSIRHRLSKEKYISHVESIKENIRRGDVYELNFCQEFYATDTVIDPLKVFNKLNEISRAPFTSYFKNGPNSLLCASPERFLKRQNNKLISQPIKGTRKRSADPKQDKIIQRELFHDEKERSENVMIVDLVRNDLAKIAIRNSVEVEELFGIYTFEQVHQMISTITCTIDAEITFAEIIKATFPMGSMTGAPKLSAMQLIEQLELTRRGLFSGAVGYITPKGNFDFNVVIRSILYNHETQFVSVQAGSAITIDCDAEKEYEECLLKAKAMLQALHD